MERFEWKLLYYNCRVIRYLDGFWFKKKLYIYKPYRQLYYMSTSPRSLTPFTEEKWCKFYAPTKRNRHGCSIEKKVKVRSPNGDTHSFDIVAGVLQGETLAQYLFIFCREYMLRSSIDKIKENGFKLTKERSRRYLAKTITDVDYADDIALLPNAPAQAETLLRSLKQAAAGIDLHVNAQESEYEDH